MPRVKVSSAFLAPRFLTILNAWPLIVPIQIIHQIKWVTDYTYIVIISILVIALVIGIALLHIILLSSLSSFSV
jgi:hypothetical protein